MNISSVLKKKMFKETLIYSIGSFGSKILSFLLIPFYTYFISKKDLGEYDLLITTISLFVPLVSLQISDSAYRWLIDKEKISDEEKGKIITNSLLALSTGYIIFFIVFLVYTSFNDFQYHFYFIVLIFLNCLLPLLQNILRGLGETKKFAFNGLITTFLVVLFNIVFIYFLNLNVEGIFLANIVAYVIACTMILTEINLVKHFKLIFWDKKLVKSMIGYSLPLIPNLMGWWAISSASKFIILHYLGAESNGLYAVASRFPVLLLVINSVLLMPLQDRVLKEKDNLTFNKLLNKFIIFELVLAILLGMISPLITKILVADEYFSTWEYMPYLYLGVAYNAIAGFLGLKYQKDKNTLKITITTLIGALVSVVLSILLITKIGLQGVSIAFLVGFMIMVLTRYYDIFKREISPVFFTLIILAPIPIYLSTSLISKIIEHLI